MELKRLLRVASVILLVVGNFTTAVALPEITNETGSNLDCTNDFVELMSCQFKAQNCAQYNLTLLSNSGYGEKDCVFQECDTGPCCCSIQMRNMLIYWETLTATVKKDTLIVETKIIDVVDSIKPKAPTLISLRKSNGNFQLKWKTNAQGTFDTNLAANVTYYKKGDTEKVTIYVEPITVDGLRYYEIPDRDLEPSTTYVVSVRNYAIWSGKYSDSSEEWEFTTDVSPNAVLLAIIISLSVFAVMITGVIYGSYVKLKTKWWDTISSPKLLIHPNHHEFLKPEPLLMCSVNVEPHITDDSKSCLKGLLIDTSSGSTQQSSGISTGSSCLSYANTEPADIIAGVQDALCKAFPNISPISPETICDFLEPNKDSDLFSVPSDPPGLRADDMSSGSSGFDNRTYSLLLPSCPQQIMTGSSDVQTEMVCDSAYHLSEGDTVACAEQQVPACPVFNLSLLASSPIPTDMSYHQCNADSAYAEDSSLSSVSSGSNTTCDLVPRVEAGCESFDEVVSGETKLNAKKEETLVCDENPCYGHVPAGSHSFLPVDDDYQAFQNLVKQPDVLLPDQISFEKQENLDKYPEESFAKIPPVIPGFIDSVPGGQCLPELQRPLISLMSSHMPAITDSGYQSV